MLNGGGATYSCKCLNVTIHSHPPNNSTSPADVDSQFTHLFVADSGISIAHPQLTLRTRKRVPLSDSQNKCSRYTSLTCLLCNILVYRIHQTISADSEFQLRDGPQIPTDDWVEQEILKSLSGWIQVHSACLSGDAVTQLRASPNYSHVFAVVLPPVSAASPTESPLGSRSSSPDATSASVLKFKPLYPPAVFTPSHPVFVHLSSLATASSQDLRAAAEEEVAQFIRARTARVSQFESTMRKQVETLWKTFRDNLAQLESEQSASRSHAVSSTVNGRRVTGPISPGTPSSVIRDFEPSPHRVASRPNISHSAPRVSTLSASLATSAFHHPREQQQTSLVEEPVARRNGDSSPSADSSSSHTLSTLSQSTQPSLTSTVNAAAAVNGQSTPVNVLGFPRMTNDAINTAASHRWFLIEEEMQAREAQKAKETSQKEAVVNGKKRAMNLDPSAVHVNSKNPETTINGKKRTVEAQPETEKEQEPPVDNPGKGKRVTFDVVTTETASSSSDTVEESVNEKFNGAEMMFPFEDQDDHNGQASSSLNPLPLLEQPAIIQRPPRSTKKPTSAAAYGSLRPSSLPAFSDIRPIRSESSSTVALGFRRPVASGSGSNTSSPLTNGSSRPRWMPVVDQVQALPEPEIAPYKVKPRAEGEDDEDPRDAEIRRLVAADTPSHRGTWDKDGAAWQRFAGRNGRNIDDEHDDDDDDDDDDADNDTIQLDDDGVPATFVGSLPISIRATPRRQPLSLQSYRQENDIEPSPQADPPTTSGAARRARYAERDLTRSRDPGALDFTIAEEDNAQDDEESSTLDDASTSAPSTVGPGQRGRQHALRILQSRNNIPEAGMWRSLA